MYKIYDEAQTNSFMFDSHFDDVTPVLDHNKTSSRVSITTFDEFPRVYRAGHTNFQTFTLSTVFYSENEISAYEQMKEFENFIKANRSSLYIEDGFGRYYPVDVEIMNIRSSKLGSVEYHNYVEVVVEVLQLGKIETR